MSKTTEAAAQIKVNVFDPNAPVGLRPSSDQQVTLLEVQETYGGQNAMLLVDDDFFVFAKDLQKALVIAAEFDLDIRPVTLKGCIPHYDVYHPANDDFVELTPGDLARKTSQDLTIFTGPHDFWADYVLKKDEKAFEKAHPDHKIAGNFDWHQLDLH